MAGWRRVAGWLWSAIWALVLYAFVAPWGELGGVVDERLRWSEWLVLGAAFVVGWTAGGLGRDASRPGSGRCHARLLRLLLMPQAALTAAGLILLQLAEMRDPIGVVVTGFLSYWAGVDLSFGALPLIAGRAYRFRGPIESTATPDVE